MTFEKLNIPYGQSSLAGLVLYQFLTVKIQKKIWIVISRFFI